MIEDPEDVAISDDLKLVLANLKSVLSMIISMPRGDFPDDLVGSLRQAVGNIERSQYYMENIASYREFEDVT